MRLDYDARLRLRRVLGVLGPVLLLPAALWLYLVTPPSALAGPLPADAGGAPPAPAVTATGVVVRATALPDGSFDVTETVRLSEPVAEVHLAPRDVAAAGAPFATAAPQHSEVQVVVPDAEPVPVPQVGDGVTVELADASASVEVRYHLTGATVRTVPGPPGRALGAVLPLTDEPGQVVGFELDGQPVLAVACPQQPADASVCGVDDGEVLVVEPVPADAAVLVVQLDLGS